MKKLILFFSILVLSAVTINAQNNYITQNAKNIFNIQKAEFESNDNSNKGLTDWIAGSNVLWQYTLINGGYFTIGSFNGLSSSVIDDNCQFTFGHPFALSSFPFPIINGYEYSPLEVMINQTGTLEEKEDSLIYTVNLDNICEAKFIIDQTSERLRISYKLTNISAVEQSFGMGLMYDAANGKWDDGEIIYDNNFLTDYTQITTDIQDSLVFWERKQNAKGVGFCMHFTDNKPNEITIGNWQNLYYDNEILTNLFDLALLKKWDETTVAAGEFVSFSIELELLSPDYNNQPFIRWDMPSALSVESQILFPMEINTTAQIISGNQNLSNLNLYTPENNNIIENSSNTNFNIDANDDFTYQTFKMELSEMYDSVVFPVSFKLMQGGSVVDELIQNIFVPASPFSDEGLIINADSVFTHEDKMVVRFDAKKETTEQYVYDLRKTNIFLWEGQTRIQEFDLEKDTTGGTNKSDIIFVVDVSGSMQDDINQVRDNIIELADSLTTNGIDFRLGMITYEYGIENTYDFTNDVSLFWSYLNGINVSGGTENALLALMAATEFDFRDDAARTIIWLTDEPFEENNSICSYTRQDVIDAMLIEGITTHCIGKQMYYVNWYEQIVMNTGGSFFDIEGNFRDILLTLAQSDANPKYLLSYIPEGTITNITTYTVEVHYAGLGGEDIIIYTPEIKTKLLQEQKESKLFPNPTVNSKTYINIDDKNATSYLVQIFDITGNKLYEEAGDIQSKTIEIDLKELNSSSQFVVKLTIFDDKGRSTFESFKLIKK